MGMKISDTFHGYLRIAEDCFAYTLSNQIVTLLPAKENKIEQIRISEKVLSRQIDSHEYLYGEDGNSDIAFLKVSDFHRRVFTIDPTLWFSPPLIIKANGNAEGYYKNLTENWDRFHAIAFCGGNINAIYDPQMALQKRDKQDSFSSDGSIDIRVLPKEEYTLTTTLNADEKTKLTISISKSGQHYDKACNEAYSLGLLNAYIQLSFETVQNPDAIEKYYLIAKSFIAFLTRQNNVSFEVVLRQRNPNNHLFDNAVCKVFDGYENYSNKDRYGVIPVQSIIDQVPLLVEKIAGHEFDALFAILPDNNKTVSRITITNVQDMCTALQVAYEWKKRVRIKDDLIDQLKTRIKETVKEFKKNYPELDPFKETTIYNSFSYLDFTLREKIWTLYQENKDIVDIVSKKWSIPYLQKDNIGAFVKLRNSKTHSSSFEWSNQADIYPVLFALVYSSALDYIKVPREVIKDLVYRLF